MIASSDWMHAFARQADADLRAWELYQQYPNAVATECHLLLYLQMACEKLCKAHLIRQGAPPMSVQASHGYIAKPLRVIIKQEISYRKYARYRTKWVMTHVAHLAREIELLNPAVQRDGQRPDNCEYPWEWGDKVISPLDHAFAPSKLLVAPAGRTFLKLLRSAINRIL